MSNPNKLGHYRIEKQIGVGSFAVVELATHELLNTKVAIKKISKKRINVSKNFDRYLNELKLYKKLHHENIIQMFEVEDAINHFCIIMEYATEGDMHVILNSVGKFSETEARVFFRQLIRGVEYCHTNNVAHRDLKLENILVTQKNLIKVADFGLSAFLKGGEFMQTSCGSIRYADPELLRGRPYSGEMADVWSCGVILFALLTGYLPFEDDVFGFILKKILKNSIEFPDDISDDAKDLIMRILQPSVNKRLTLQEIKMHKWMTYESLGKHIDFQFSYDQMKNYSTFWTNKINEECYRRIEQAGFNFHDCVTREQREEAILNKKKYSFVVGYHIVFYEKLKQEFNPHILNYTGYVFKEVENVFNNLENYESLVECFKAYKLDTGNGFLRNEWSVGFNCSFSLKKIFKVLLKLFNQLSIKIEIDSKEEFKFSCILLDDKGIKTTSYFRFNIFDHTDEYFLDFQNENVGNIKFMLLMNKVVRYLRS